MITLFFVLFQLGNIAFPLTCGFISEFLIFITIFTLNPASAIFATLSIVLTPLYVLKLLHQVFYGSFSNYLLPSFDLSLKEFHLLFPLVFLLFILGIFPNIIFNSIAFEFFLILF